MPDEVKPEVQTGLDTFALLQESPESLDWFYVSPPQDFGSWLGTESKGEYVLAAATCCSATPTARRRISADDLAALRILDEIETPQHAPTAGSPAIALRATLRERRPAASPAAGRPPR